MVKSEFFVFHEKIRTLPKIHTLRFSYFTKKFVLDRNIHTLLKISYLTKKLVHQMNRCNIPLGGVLAVVHSDNDPAFISQVFKAAMSPFDVCATTTPVYNPVS